MWLRGDLNLCPHEVDPRHHFRHGMLDLNARVHFKKVELALRPEELDSPRIAVSGGPSATYSCVAHDFLDSSVRTVEGDSSMIF